MQIESTFETSISKELESTLTPEQMESQVKVKLAKKIADELLNYFPIDRLEVGGAVQYSVRIDVLVPAERSEIHEILSTYNGIHQGDILKSHSEMIRGFFNMGE
jgi:hypothetical protein